jgi:anaerobic ribonucleoside-triphosphate reductase
MRPVPCANLVEHQPPSCSLGRVFPSDCADCPHYDPGITLAERTRCEIWTRVMGYHRPVAAFNAGKRAEHEQRVMFKETPNASTQ